MSHGWWRVLRTWTRKALATSNVSSSSSTTEANSPISRSKAAVKSVSSSPDSSSSEFGFSSLPRGPVSCGSPEGFGWCAHVSSLMMWSSTRPKLFHVVLLGYLFWLSSDVTLITVLAGGIITKAIAKYSHSRERPDSIRSRLIFTECNHNAVEIQGQTRQHSRSTNLLGACRNPGCVCPTKAVFTESRLCTFIVALGHR